MRKWIINFSVILVLGLGISGYFYQRIFTNNLKGESGTKHEFFVRTGADYSQMLDNLAQQVLIHPNNFDFVAQRMDIPEKVKAGRYIFTVPMSSYDIAAMLRSGNQAPVKLTTRKARSKEEVAGLIGQKLEADSLSVLTLLNNPQKLDSLGFSDQTILALFIPNTFEFYWNTSADEFLERMKKEYDKYWTEERRKLAADQGLSPIQVSILASIVEEESEIKAERPTIAGLYLNRFKKGMALQADPTVKFATQNFGARRVLYSDLTYESPYNTYVYAGLPPGPICTPSINAIEAVLNAESHDYLFMCAKPNNEIGHVFAKTLDQHNENARKYRKWLNERGIYR